ncbi:MAG: beta-hydroxyacyl-ACP dehydratase [Phycisphaerales bacterium]
MRWMWIDRITEFVDGQRMVAIKNVSLAEEHLHDHFAADGEGETARAAEPVMPASLIIEGMAQTAGILVGAASRFREKVILAKIASAELDHEARPGDQLQYAADVERMDEQGASCRGTVTCRRAGSDTFEPIGTINLLFSHVDQNRAGAIFPDENFVFSDNFRGILRAAGLDHLADA